MKHALKFPEAFLERGERGEKESICQILTDLESNRSYNQLQFE